MTVLLFIRHVCNRAAILKAKNIIDQIYKIPPVQVDQAQQPGAGAGAAGGQPGAGAGAIGGQPGGGAGAAGGQPAAVQVEERDHDSSSLANRVLISVIISYLDDKLAIPFLARIQQDNAANKLLSYREYLKQAMSLELRSGIYPTTDLRYGRNLFPSSSNIQLNNMELPIIHPSMTIPKKRRGYFPSDLAHMYYNTDNHYDYNNIDGHDLDPLNVVPDPNVNDYLVPPVNQPLVPNVVQPIVPNVAYPLPPLAHAVPNMQQPRALLWEDPQEQLEAQAAARDDHPVPQVPIVPPQVQPPFRPDVSTASSRSSTGQAKRVYVRYAPKGDASMRDTMVQYRSHADNSMDSTRSLKALDLDQSKGKQITAANKSGFRTSTPVDQLFLQQSKVDLSRLPVNLPGEVSTRPKTRSQTAIARTVATHREVPPNAKVYQTPQGLYFIDTDGSKVHIYDPNPNYVVEESDAETDYPRSNDASSAGSESLYQDVDLMTTMLQNMVKTAVGQAVSQESKSKDNKSSERKTRPYSNDRDSKDKYKDSRRDRSDSRNRNPRYSNRRSQSRDRYRRDSTSDGRRRTPSRDRSNNYDRSRTRYRTPSTGRNNSRRDNYDRSNDRNRRSSYDRSNQRRNSYSNDYDRKKSPYRYERRDFSRERSRENKRNLGTQFAVDKSYPYMRNGVNCSNDYNPAIHKHCNKCTVGHHHEFECPTYSRWNPEKCAMCERLNHFAADCNEKNKFPPKTVQPSKLKALNYEGL